MCARPVLPLPAVSPALPLYHFLTIDMVRTRGGSRLRPRVRFSTPEQEEQPPASAVVLEPVPEEPQGFKRYHTRMGPWGPFPSASETIQEGPTLQAGPFIRDRGSHRHPGLSHHNPRQQQRRAHRPIFLLLQGSDDPFLLGPPIPGNVDLRARDFHGAIL